MADSGHPPAELHERLLICRTIKLNAGAHGGHRRCCHAQMQKNAQNKPQIARLILCVHTTLQVYCNLFLTFCSGPPHRMVERPAAYLLSRSSGCIRSRNWRSNWKYRLHCRTSRSRTGGSTRSPSTYRRPYRSAACRCRYRCRWDLWSTCRRQSRSSACSRDCSTAAGRSLGIRGRRSSRCRKKPFYIPP